MKGSKHNRISEFLYNLVNPYAFTLHTCPFKLSEYFILKDFYLKQKELPLVFPLGEYRTDLEFLENENAKTIYCQVQIFYIVKSVK